MVGWNNSGMCSTEGERSLLMQLSCKGCYSYLLSSLPAQDKGLKVALNYGYSHSVVSSALFRAFSVHALDYIHVLSQSM